MYSKLILLSFSLLFLSFGVSLQAFEFSGTFPTKDYPYTIHKSGQEVCSDLLNTVAWLDNNRVIFTRLKRDEPFLQRRIYHDGIYHGETVIWDTTTNKTTPYHDGELRCSYNGYSTIFYNHHGERNINNPYYLSGFEGKESDLPFEKSRDFAPHSINPHTCISNYNNQPLFTPQIPWIYPLREQDGAIANVRNQFINNRLDVVTIRPEGTRINLSITSDDIRGAWWEEWAKVYILNMVIEGGYKKYLSIDHGLLMLHPDGTIERYQIPNTYWYNKDTARAAISKKGIVVVNEQVDVMHNQKGSSGAYLIRGDKVIRLNDWYVGNAIAGNYNITRGIAVSPDGCKIAYKHTDGLREKTVSTIEMINLCEGEE